MTNEQKYELAMLRDLRALCPKKGSGVDTIEISSGKAPRPWLMTRRDYFIGQAVSAGKSVEEAEEIAHSIL